MLIVALQLLSHLEGDALNVALLVTEAQRATQIGLVSALTDRRDDWRITGASSSRRAGRTLRTRLYLQ